MSVAIDRPVAGPIGLVLIALLIALGLGGCGVAGASPSKSICDGVSTDIGPCGGMPSFSGTTCDSLAAEYGSELDRVLLEVVRGPDDLGGNKKSVRLLHAEVFATTSMTNRMIGLGLIEQCRMPAFLDATKSRFSDELKATVGHAVYDGLPDVSYPEFLDLLARVMGGIGKKP